MPRRIEFSLSLKRVDESLSDMFGSLSDQLSNLQDSATSAIGNMKNTVGGTAVNFSSDLLNLNSKTPVSASPLKVKM